MGAVAVPLSARRARDTLMADGWLQAVSIYGQDSTQGNPRSRRTPQNSATVSAATADSFSFAHSISLIMSRYPEVSICFVQYSTFRSFWSVTSLTRASKGTTTMVTHPIQQRAISTNQTMPRIRSRLPKTTRRVLTQQATRHQLKSINRTIHPWARATIPLTCHTANHPHRITTNHTPRLLILFTPSLHHHRHPFFNRSSSSRTLLSPPTNLTVLPTSTTLPHL